MPIKRFGRLAGSTTAMDAQADTTPANAPTPYQTVEPATKMFAYGEGVTAQSINRAIGSVAANVEDLLVLLDTPTTKAEILEPSNGGGIPEYGFTNLMDVTPSSGVSLGLGTRVPVVWVHVGLHQSQLGQFIQLAHEPSDSNASRSVILRPTDVRAYSGAGAHFPAATYPLSPEHSCPNLIPPIAAIESELAPYLKVIANASVAVADWDTDGCRLAATTWSSMHMRAGCYVHIQSGDQRGLYMIAAISNNKNSPADDKAVLVNSLHRVVTDGTTTLVPGGLVTWSRMTGASPAIERTNSAYVLFVDVEPGGDDTVYLSTFSGSDDVTDSVLPAKASTGFAAAFNRGSLGYQEDEVGDNPAGLIQVGTFLYNSLGAAAGTVEAHTPAGAPVRFTPGAAAAQTAIMCSPPGFLLNPHLVLPAGQGGRYRGYCRTLTTARERMRSGALTPTRGSWLDDGAMQQFTPLYQRALEDYTQWSRQGYQPVVPYAQTPAWDALSSSAQVLGDNLWEMRVELVAGAGPPTLEDAGAVPGMTIRFTDPTLGAGAITTARVAHVDGDFLWLHGVSNRDWDVGLDRRTPPLVDTPAAESTFSVAGNNYKILSISYAPYRAGRGSGFSTLTGAAPTVQADGLEVVGGAGSLWNTELEVGDTVSFMIGGEEYTAVVGNVVNDGSMFLANPVLPGSGVMVLSGTPFIPGSGLNAAYHAHYDGDPNARGDGGAGRVIQLATSRGVTPVVQPVVLQAPTAAAPAFTALEVVNPTGTVVGALASDGTVLQFRDGNTTVDIDLSSTAPDTRINAALPQSILGALNSAGLAHSYTWSNAVVSGAVVTPNGAAGVDISTGVFIGDGQVVTIPGVINSLPALGAGDWYLVFDGTTTLAWTQAAPTAIQTALCKVTSAAPNLSSFKDMRLLLGGVNEQIDIQVGGPNAHFATVGEAVELVNALGTPGSGNPARKYRIRVRGDTLELATVVFTTSGVVIEGVPGLSPQPNIVWAGDQALFDLNGQTDLVFRDLALRYEDVAATRHFTHDRVAFHNISNVTYVFRLTIDNVSIRSASAGMLHGYMMNRTNFGYDGVRITNCDWSGATDFGVNVLAGNFHMSDCRLTRVGATQNGAADGGDTLGGVGGVRLEGLPGSTNHGSVRTTHLQGWGNRGVVLVTCYGVRVDSCYIAGGVAEGTTTKYVGIEIDSGCARCFVVQNETTTAGAVATLSYGLECAGARVLITGNYLVGSPGVATRKGYVLTAASQYCIVDANQTGGQGSTAAGGPHSIGAMNRDDA